MPDSADVKKVLKSRQTGELQMREFQLELIVTKIPCRTVGTCPNVGGTNLQRVIEPRAEVDAIVMISKKSRYV